jgi:hypothetical protein
MNAALDEELIERNPFRGLSHRCKSRGRADQAPPTHEELAQLLDACRVRRRQRDPQGAAALRREGRQGRWREAVGYGQVTGLHAARVAGAEVMAG